MDSIYNTAGTPTMQDWNSHSHTVVGGKTKKKDTHTNVKRLGGILLEIF
jgi:hypothetical protein